jgi:dynamin 1/3
LFLSVQGAGKSAVLNSLIGHPVLVSARNSELISFCCRHSFACEIKEVVAVVQPTGENGATRAPIVVDLQRDPGLSSKSIVLQIDSKSQQVSASE